MPYRTSIYDEDGNETLRYITAQEPRAVNGPHTLRITDDSMRIGGKKHVTVLIDASLTTEEVSPFLDDLEEETYYPSTRVTTQ